MRCLKINCLLFPFSFSLEVYRLFWKVPHHSLFFSGALPSSLVQMYTSWFCPPPFFPMIPFIAQVFVRLGFPGGSYGKESACNVGRPDSIPGSGRSSREGEWLSTPVFLPGAFHGQRSLAGYHPLGCKESDMTELLTHTYKLMLIYYNSLLADLHFQYLFLLSCS